MLAKPSKCLALIMVLFIVGFSVAPVQALCDAPCCKTVPVAPEPVANAPCHEDRTHKSPENTPPCLLEGHHNSDVAIGGSTSELRGNRLLDAQWAFLPVALHPSTWSPEASAPGSGPHLLYPIRPIYLLTVSLLC